MAIKVDRLLAGRIREARKGVKKLRDDPVTKGGPQPVSFRRELIENKLRSQFNIVIVDSLAWVKLAQVYMTQ
jgi:hypothetical protein